MRIFRAPEFLGTAFMLAVLGLLVRLLLEEPGMSAAIPFSAQLINLFAAVILLLAFAMLAQRRMPALINLFALQGLALCLATLVAAVTTGQVHLYYSAGLTLALKVLLLPWILHRLVRQLKVKGEVEP
jgi:hydrogenase-4 component E